ncbi:hypothetical protein Tco_0565597 [Tanacetum coccineum]
MELVQGATPICEGSCRLTSLERQEVWNDCRSCKVRVGSNGNLLWEASVLLGRKKGGVRVAREDDRRVSEGREDVREVFQQRGSGAKRKLSRCGRNQIGNEPILALPEGANDFVVYYDARSKDLEACLEKGEGGCLLTNRWLSMKKDIASCGSKYLAYSEVEVEYQGSSGLLLQPELWVVEGLTLEMCSTYGKKDKLEPSYVGTFEIFVYIGPTCCHDELRVLMPRVVKSRDEIFSRWGYCDNHDLSRLDNQSIERDRLIGIGFVLNFVKFISFTFGDKEMISAIEAVSIMRMLRLKEVARKTVGMHLEFAPDYAFSDSLLLTPLCCDDIHDVTPRVSALAGCDRLVSEPLVIENILVMFSPTRKKSRWGTVFPTGLKRYKEPLVEPKEIG